MALSVGNLAASRRACKGLSKIHAIIDLSNANRRGEAPMVDPIFHRSD
jgi:hypothetical protein